MYCTHHISYTCTMVRIWEVGQIGKLGKFGPNLSSHWSHGQVNHSVLDLFWDAHACRVTIQLVLDNHFLYHML